jgi:hypothetical protein
MYVLNNSVRGLFNYHAIVHCDSSLKSLCDLQSLESVHKGDIFICDFIVTMNVW